MNDASMKTKPVVSICVLTYNHEAYIHEAIEGVLLQKVDFEIELVIGDDCSTDRTRAIVGEYVERHPTLIRLLTSKRNCGLIANLTRTLEACRGKYLAFCEGDDYWTDPNKLQMQIDFLEMNPEYSFTFHDTLILNQETRASARRIGQRKIETVVNLESVIIENNCPTASIVCKNILNPKTFPAWFPEVPGKNDYSMILILAEKGLGKYFPAVMSVYRVHQRSVWSTKQEGFHYVQNRKYWKLLLGYYEDPKLKKAIRGRINLCDFNHSIALIEAGNLLSPAGSLVRSIRLYRDKRLRSKLGKIPLAFASSIKQKVLRKTAQS
jgi:glycosyltransferase involved in cell wall biosynthesis